VWFIVGEKSVLDPAKMNEGVRREVGHCSAVVPLMLKSVSERGRKNLSNEKLGVGFTYQSKEPHDGFI